jgi:peptidyl-prolyl cis-trans isomerase B (cyclophilin B)
MADHKAPTQVSIAPYQETSRLQKMASTFWMPFVVIVIAVTALIMVNQSSEQSAQADVEASWNRLGGFVSLETLGQGTELPSGSALGQLATDLNDTPAGPWAKALEVRSYLEARQWDQAQTALTELEATYPDHILVTGNFPIGTEGAPETIASQLRTHMTSQRAFVDANPSLFKLKAVPEGAPRVKISTSAGDITVALFEAEAPEHVANFLKLASNGYYEGSKFHRVIPGFMIQAGDPNTKVGDQVTWGQGGPDYKLPMEFSDLYHFKGVLAMAKMGGETESSGSQFYITTGTPHYLDGEHTVFGAVLEGEDTTVRKIENAPQNPESSFPDEPATITGMTVL